MIILGFLIISILLYILFKKQAKYWERKGVLSEKPWPLIGNMLDVLLIRKNIAILIGDLYKKYPGQPYFGMWTFAEPNLVIRSPDLIKHILIKDFEYFYDRSVQSNEKVDPYSAFMMFFSRNPKWKYIRNVTTPIFTSGKLKYIYPSIQAVAKNLISFIQARQTRAFDTKNVTSKYTTDVICSIAFGIDAHSFQDSETPFTEAAQQVFGLNFRTTVTSALYFLKNPLVDIFRIKLIKTSTAEFLAQTFLGMIKERESSGVKRRDLLEIMIKLRDQFNLDKYELVSQADQFFLAGYETSSVAITFCLYELSRNKNVQTKLREELNSIVDDNGEFSYAVMVDTKTYLHKCILETLRKYPSVPLLGRECSKNYRIPNSDMVIEKGSSVMIPLMGLHYDPDYFPDPDAFNPERFSEENIKKMHPYCYLPFGTGQRSCIGERIALISVKMAVAFLVTHFQMELEDDDLPMKILPTSFILNSTPIILRFKEIN